MISEVNFPAVVAAAVATMVLAAVWYGPLFGKLWMRAHGYTPDRLEEMSRRHISSTSPISSPTCWPWAPSSAPGGNR